MKLLVAAPETLGEIVCSTALLRCIKSQVQAAEIHYWVTPEWAAAVAHHTAIFQLHVQHDDPSFFGVTPFDAMIDLRSDRMLRRWARQRQMTYYGINASFLVSFLSEHFGLMNAAAGRSITHRFFDAVKPLNVYDDGLGAEYFLAPSEHIQQKDLPASHSAGYIVLVTGDHDYDVAVPEILLASFCRELQYPLVLVNSRGNNKTAQMLTAIDPVKIYNACGKFTLNETADIIRKGRLVISSETGLMQVAAAFKKPLMVLRSSDRQGMYFPPCYGQEGRGERQRYISWIWPEEKEVVAAQKSAQKNVLPVTEPWIIEGLQGVRKMLEQWPQDHLL